MNAAKIMPVDLAMHMGINRPHPVKELIIFSTPRFSRPTMSDSQQLKFPRSPQYFMPKSNTTSPSGIPKKKKQVVFADTKGLSLTVVHIFKSDPPISDTEQLSSPDNAKEKRQCLRLGFPQPFKSPSFAEDLTKCLVHLESCNLMNKMLFGKIRVCNISQEKTVNVRITFDSWKSHLDIPCSPIEDQRGNSKTELFFFKIPLTDSLSVQDRLEFCVSFRAGQGSINMWDNNGGQNYRILVEEIEEAPKKKIENIRIYKPSNHLN